jgi:hypothetical protein
MTLASSGRLAMRNTLQPITAVKLPLQLFMALDSRELTSISETEHRTMIKRLAHLILEASGVEIKEVGNDER